MPRQIERSSRELPVPIDNFKTSEKVLNNRPSIVQYDFWASIHPNVNPKILLELMLHQNISTIRINISKFDSAKSLLAKVVEFERIKEEYALNTSLFVDTGGPKIRVCSFLSCPNPTLQIYKDETIILVDKHSTVLERVEKLNQKTIVLNGSLPTLKPETIIFISDGWQQLIVVEVETGFIVCRSLHDSEVFLGRGVTFSGMHANLDKLTNQDKAYIGVLLDHGCSIDMIGLSFVESSDDIRLLREEIARYNTKAKVFSKIETLIAVKQLPGIIKSCDGIMIARGDLAVDIADMGLDMLDIEDIIVEECQRYNCPCVIATRVADSLESGASELDYYEKYRLYHEILRGKKLTLMLANETVDSVNATRNVHTVSRTVRALMTRGFGADY